jgi:hypothetical protein
MSAKLNKTLEANYYDPSLPSGYASVDKLYKATQVAFPNLQRGEVENWLRSQDTYTRHVPVRHRFPRNKVLVAGIDEQWQADLSDLSALKQYNRQYRFLLCVIDAFSKYAWVTALKDKTGATLVREFKRILRERTPQRLQTDKGTEFLNRKVQTLLRERNIHFFTTENPETKASIVERFQRTLKGRMWKYFYRNKTLKYIDVLSKFVIAYNKSHHRSIGRAPTEVSEDNEHLVSATLYGNKSPQKKNKKTSTRWLKVGDTVRISKTKKTFEKGYKASYTGEIFTVDSVVTRRQPVVYRLRDADGEQLAGTFYKEELSEVTHVSPERLWEIEKTIDEKKNKQGKHMVLVRWKHYPSKFDSWIPKRDLKR